MRTKTEFLWSQKYRPKKIKDLILSDEIKETLQSFVNEGNLPNFIFHSTCGGTGKTSAALAMADELGIEAMMINASEERSIDVIRTKMSQYCSTKSIDGRRKLLILDESDQLPELNQNALRNFFEKFSSNCAFVMTCNNLQRIIQPLHSRCAVVEFKFPKEEKPKLAGNFFKRTCDILDQEGITYDRKLVQHIIVNKFPDFRRCINELQRYSAGGELSENILSNIQNNKIEVLIEAIEKRKFNDIRKFIIESWNGSEQDLYRALYDELNKVAEPSSLPDIIPILSRYGFESNFAVDFEIHTLACMVELMSLPISFK